MKKTLYKMMFAAAIGVVFNPAQAELFVNPIVKNKSGAGEGSIHFGASSVDYEAGGSTGDIDRTFIGATYAHGLNSSFDIYGTFSLTLESELEFSSSDGDGYILGGGVRAGIPNDLGVNINGYAQLLMIDEDYGNSIDGDEMSIMFGAVASKALDSKIKIYGGLEFNLYSDMDIEGSDADRDDFLGVRLGVNFNFGNVLMNVNTSLMHETGIFVSASQPF